MNCSSSTCTLPNTIWALITTTSPNATGNFSSRRGVGWYARIKKLSPRGVLGDATLASAEKGERMWAVMIHNLVEFIEDLKGLTLDELYQRRY